ncbi:MAG: efflux RND transporter permease subunit [Thermoanaerobaculia bacterium]
MSRLTDVSLKHRATVFFSMLVVIIAGLFAYLTLPRESSPDVQIPMIIVYTLYPGAAPADIESIITEPIERELQGLEDMKELTSVSQESASVVTIEFESGTDIDDARQKVRDRVDQAKVDFPDDAEEPVLQEINFSEFPVVQVNLAGDVGPAVLKELAEDLQDELETVPGVLRVNLVGGLEREVRVDVDLDRLNSYGLSLDAIVGAIGRENVAIPGGDLDVGDQSFSVRVPGEVENPLEIADFVVSAKGGNPVYVRDVATVTYGFKDRESHARINGQESVAVTVQKRLGANIIDVVDAVKTQVAEEQESWPASVRATVLGDQSRDIRNMVADLENNILSGLILVVAVLLLAMGFRPALFVGLAIPFSMLITFFVLQATGVTLNMVVLFALVLAVGMLVDNGIVVVENIYRHMQEGSLPDTAASIATREVGAAILFSTLTTFAAFSPLYFWPGIVGDFMVYMPMTVSIALGASLLVAFTMNPVLCARFLKAAPRSAAAAGGEVAGWRGSWGAGILERYRGILGWALDHRLATVNLAIGVFVLMFVLFGMFGPGVEFFPETEPTQIFVDVEQPAGTRLEATDELAVELEERLEGLPDVNLLASSVGAGSQNDFGGGQGGGDSNVARLTIDLLEREDREQNSFLTMDQVRERTAGIPGAIIEVDRLEDGPPVGEPVQIEVRGEDFATLGAISRRIRESIRDIDGLVSLDDDFDLARPEARLHVDRTQAARFGLSTADIATAVRTAVSGTEASEYRRPGRDEEDITVRLREADRRSLADLERLRLPTASGELVPLTAVARLERTAALTAINHKERDRVVTITGDVTNPTLARPVRAEAQRRLEAIRDLLPTGYRMEFTGGSEDEQEAQAFLSKAFLYALLLVLALLVAKFDSLKLSAIVMTSVVMSMVGVFFGLLVTRLPFGIIMTGLGVISLAGVVVNNAIVLLDYGEQLRERGLPRRELVMLTGLRRFRPVMLTAVTTILGLIPLATGFGFDFRNFVFVTGGESSQWWKGLAIAVIFGLALATFLTLVVVPVLYDLVLAGHERRARKRGAGGDEDVNGELEDSLAALERDEGVLVS